MSRVTWTEESWMESFRDTRGDDAAELANRVLSWARTAASKWHSELERSPAHS